MALGAMVGQALGGQSIGQALLGGAINGQRNPYGQNGQPQQPPASTDPLLALMKKHLAGAMPGPMPMGPSPANPGYDGASGGTA